MAGTKRFGPLRTEDIGDCPVRGCSGRMIKSVWAIESPEERGQSSEHETYHCTRCRCRVPMAPPEVARKSRNALLGRPEP